jgi:hypothetical protein
MSFGGAAIFLFLIAAVCAVLMALFVRPRRLLVSVPLGLIAASAAPLAALGAWSAWAESHSIPWTVGYAALAVVSVAAAIRQFAGCGKSAPRP